MSRVLPIQPPILVRSKVWSKDQQDDLVRIWQDLTRFINNFVGPLPRGGQDVTAQVVCNVELIQFGADQGIVAIMISGDTLVVSIHCSFNVNVAAVPYISLVLPLAPEAFMDLAPLDIGTSCAYLSAGANPLKLGAIYQGTGVHRNEVDIYNNDFTSWPVDVNNVYVAGQIILPLAAPGV